MKQDIEVKCVTNLVRMPSTRIATQQEESPISKLNQELSGKVIESVSYDDKYGAAQINLSDGTSLRILFEMTMAYTGI